MKIEEYREIMQAEPSLTNGELAKRLNHPCVLVDCTGCGEAVGVNTLECRDDYDDALCESCVDNRAEAARERWLDYWYGGASPQTDRERREAGR